MVELLRLLLDFQVEGLHLDQATIDQVLGTLKAVGQSVVTHECSHFLQLLADSVNTENHLHNQALVNCVTVDNLSE